MNRKGSAVAVAIVIGLGFFTIVSALLHQSSGEMKHTKAVSAVKKAEMLAISGLNWAESKLRAGRWYGKKSEPYKNTVGQHATCDMQILNPFGSGEGKVTIVCEDVANKTPGSNMFGMQQVWFLHHINVYALGEYGNQQCLMYGRFIMSPEPLLNSDSTDGAGYENLTQGSTGAVSVAIPTVTVKGKEVKEFVVKELLVAEYSPVQNANEDIAIITPLNDSSTEIKVKAGNYGTVSEIKIKEGKTCRAGDNLLILSKSIQAGGGANAAMKTLKKMVRITKIPTEFWKTQDLDVTDRNDRYALSQYISGLSDAYLQNFVAHATLEKTLNKIGDKKFDEKMSSDEVLKNFPIQYTSTTRNRAENLFLAHMIQNFTAPGITWDKKENALNSSYLHLDQPRSAPPADLQNWLNKLGYGNLTKTKPRSSVPSNVKYSDYYAPRMKDGDFLKLLLQQKDEVYNQPPSQFIQNLSQLPDAARYIKIEEISNEDCKSSYRDYGDRIEVVIPDTGENMGTKINVEKITKGYTFVDPETGFAIELQDLFSFLKKYYDEDSCQSPRETVRVNEHIDWPLPEPAPAPPAPIEGGTWVWIPGTPGTPPGEPSYTPVGGTEEEIDPPTGSGGYLPENKGGSKGSITWDIPGIDGTPSSEEEENNNVKTIDRWGNEHTSITEKTIKEGGSYTEDSDWSDGSDPSKGKCNGGSNCCNGTPGDGSNGSNHKEGNWENTKTIYIREDSKETNEKITVDVNTNWKVTPGTPGREPTQGHYEWVKDPEDTPGKDGDSNDGSKKDGKEGSDGKSGNDGQGSQGTEGTGSGTTPSTPSTQSTPTPSPTHYNSASGYC